VTCESRWVTKKQYINYFLLAYRMLSDTDQPEDEQRASLEVIPALPALLCRRLCISAGFVRHWHGIILGLDHDRYVSVLLWCFSAGVGKGQARAARSHRHCILQGCVRADRCVQLECGHLPVLAGKLSSLRSRRLRVNDSNKATRCDVLLRVQTSGATPST
jgi:hypothetical protein